MSIGYCSNIFMVVCMSLDEELVFDSPITQRMKYTWSPSVVLPLSQDLDPAGNNGKHRTRSHSTITICLEHGQRRRLFERTLDTTTS